MGVLLPRVLVANAAVLVLDRPWQGSRVFVLASGGLLAQALALVLTAAVELPTNSRVLTWSPARHPRAGGRTGTGGPGCARSGPRARSSVSRAWSRPRPSPPTGRTRERPTRAPGREGTGEDGRTEPGLDEEDLALTMDPETAAALAALVAGQPVAPPPATGDVATRRAAAEVF